MAVKYLRGISAFLSALALTLPCYADSPPLAGNEVVQFNQGGRTSGLTREIAGVPVPATGAPISRSSSSRAADVYNTKDFGAICDGSHHSISAVLGINTLAKLAAYQNSVGGATPYSWINTTLWTSPKVALSMSVAAVTNATTLFFDSALQIPVGAVVSGTQITGSPTVTAVSNPGTVTQVTNGTTSTIGTTSITVNSGTPTPVGSHPTPQTGLSIDDYVVSSNATNITLKYGITAASIATAITLTFQPPSSVTISGSGLTANKPSVQSAASTATVNYWVYFTWTLTDAMVAAAEMDWLGTQAAIQAASTNGLVSQPAGTCIMDNATVSGNGLGGLVMPASTGGNSPTATTDLIGQGIATSVLSWPSEMGAGRAALSFGVPYATWDNGLGRYGNNFYYGQLANVSLSGPSGWSEAPVGTVNNRTWGILPGARRMMNAVQVYGFYVGATLEGVDHTRWSDVFLNANSIGLRFGPTSAILWGDDQFDHLEISGNSIANISIDKTGFWQASNINKLYCAFSPKCIRLEPGTTDNYGGPTPISFNVGNSTITGTNAESTGLCFVCDDNYGPNFPIGASLAGGEMTFVGVEFMHLGIGYSAGQVPAGSKTNFWVAVGNMSASIWQFNGTASPPLVAGMQGAFFIDSANTGSGGDLITDGFTQELQTFGSTPYFVFYGVPFNQTQYSIRVCEGNAWCGHPEIYGSSTSAGQGVPLEYTTGTGGADLSVQKAGGSAPFAGINMTTAPTNGGSTIVATKICISVAGTPSVTIPTSGTATALHQAKLAAGGTITNSTGFNTAGEVIIGTIMEVTGSAARVNVGNNGSCD